MRKPWITLTIDQELLDKLEESLLERIQKDKKVISRSAFISELLNKGLKVVK
jgi:metal-responsive CopG/Arc/MetJ family transcriptional regulator